MHSHACLCDSALLDRPSAPLDRCVLAILARQEAEGERAPGQHAHAEPERLRQYGCFDAAREDRVRRLLAAEAVQAAAIGDVVGLDDLLRVEGRRAERADLTRAHE